ncbi:hypothetical protein [Streptomyces sp. NPDC052114]|uniref:hypothetical protein n=1 Tax=unclassified Streptomyces TaxID=2593676 RepID=UPI00341D7427
MTPPAAVGAAVIATGTAPLVGRRRDRRERARERHATRREPYTSCPAVLGEARDEPRALARDSVTVSADPSAGAGEACAPCSAPRYRTQILAPPAAVGPVDGVRAGAPERERLVDRFRRELDVVRDVLRCDPAAGRP